MSEIPARADTSRAAALRQLIDALPADRRRRVSVVGEPEDRELIDAALGPDGALVGEGDDRGPEALTAPWRTLRARDPLLPARPGAIGATVDLALVLAGRADELSADELSRQLGRARARLAIDGRLVLVLGAADAETRVGKVRLPIDLERLVAEAGLVAMRELPIVGSDVRLVVLRCTEQRIRRFREGDLSALLALFGRSFHHPRGPDHWEWKYLRQPYGRFRVSVAVDGEGAPVGQYCAYPLLLDRAGAPDGEPPLEVHQVGDTMTARRVRSVGRGPTSLLARMAGHFYATFCRDRVAFNYGFNTGNIQKFSRRYVGAHFLEAAPRRVLDLGGADLTAGRGLRVRELYAGDLRLDAFYRQIRSRYGSLIVRDRRYLDWRYFGCPDAHYVVLAVERGNRLLGWGVFLREGEELRWGDALFEPEAAGHVVPALLEGAVRHFGSDSGLQRIVGWFPSRPDWFDARLRDVGFVDEDDPDGLGLVVVPFTEPEAPEWLAESWYYTWGDSDLF